MLIKLVLLQEYTFVQFLLKYSALMFTQLESQSNVKYGECILHHDIANYTL